MMWAGKVDEAIDSVAIDKESNTLRLKWQTLRELMIEAVTNRLPVSSYCFQDEICHDEPPAKFY